MGHLDGKAVFVPFVLPGEIVEVGIQRRSRQYYEAELVTVLEPAPERVDPPCSYFKKCGGCQWQHMSYETQLLWKQNILQETLQRVAKIENPNVLPTIPSPKYFGWRSRVTLHGNEAGEIGFFEAETHKVVDIERCLIVEEPINEQLAHLRRTTRNEQRATKKDYEVRATSKKGFTQVNPLQNENLKQLLKEWAQKIPHDFIVELFCGSGNFTEVLIPIVNKIIAVDSDRNAIELAQQKKVQSTSYNVQFLCTDAVKFFAQYKPETSLDLLVLDPPRDGAAGVVEGVLKTKPKNILYISCNPESLARDLKYLKDFAGYELVQSQPIDMFPMSYHIESLSWISSK